MLLRENYLLTKEFVQSIVDVQQVCAKSAGRYWSGVRHLVEWAGNTALAQAPMITPTFQAYVLATEGEGQLKFAPSTIKKIFQMSRRFFTWAKQTYPAEFRTVTPRWIEALSPPRRLVQATPSSHLDADDFVTPEDVRRLLAVPIAPQDLAGRRDQAAAAMLFLSGMRAGAFGSLPIEGVDMQNLRIRQWPELGVHTKNSKRATTYLLPIPDLLKVVQDWDAFIRAQLPFTAAWFTPIVSRFGKQQLSTDLPGLNRNIAVSDRLEILFDAAGLAYRSAHKFRHGHALYGLLHARTMADYKAVSRNLMHQDVTMTDAIYAALLDDEVEHRIAKLTEGSGVEGRDEVEMDTYLHTLSQDQLIRVMKVAASRLQV